MSILKVSITSTMDLGVIASVEKYISEHRSEYRTRSEFIETACKMLLNSLSEKQPKAKSNNKKR